MKEFLKKDFIFACLIASFAGFSHQVFNIVFPVYILDIGGTNAMTGLMMVGLTIATIVTRFMFGTLIDEWGRKKTLLLGSALFTVNTFAYCFVHDFTGLFVLRICNGISQGIFFPVPPTVVSDHVSPRKLSDALGLFGICSSLPVAFAPTLGLYVYKSFGANTLFMLTTGTALIAVGLAAGITDHYVPQKSTGGWKEKMKLSQIIELSIIAPSLIYMFIYFGYSSITNFITPYGISKGIDSIGLFFTVNTLTVIFARLLAGRVANVLGIINTICLGIGASVCSSILTAFMDSRPLMFVSSVLLGIGITFVTQLTQVYVLNHADEHRKGVANTTWMLLGDLGTGAGSMLWGFVSTNFGYFITYLLSAAVMGMGYPVGKFKLGKRKVGSENGRK